MEKLFKEFLTGLKVSGFFMLICIIGYGILSFISMELKLNLEVVFIVARVCIIMGLVATFIMWFFKGNDSGKMY